jgi:hypothetical protein
MGVEPAESAAIRATWSESGYFFDLRWYGTQDFIVPLWWIGITDIETEELNRTEVLHPGNELPGGVFRWLIPIVGQEIARQLITWAASDTLLKPASAS